MKPLKAYRTIQREVKAIEMTYAEFNPSYKGSTFNNERGYKKIDSQGIISWQGKSSFESDYFLIEELNFDEFDDDDCKGGVCKL